MELIIAMNIRRRRFLSKMLDHFVNKERSIKIDHQIISDRIKNILIGLISNDDELTRWKKDAKEFGVRITEDNSGSLLCRIPKPVFEFLGAPDGLKFMIKGKNIVIIGEKDENKKN
ncbi:MAG: hypothetical protein FJ356_04655 [Thaumarchaeota archaeon]|nr:hypothetical protein [Nitrososphaerota archaeon]